MSKVRVPVLGTVGKSIQLDPTATKGATLGVNLFDADGNVLDADALALLLPADTITVSRDIPATPTELAVGAPIINGRVEPGNVLRYGTNTTPGTTDMTAALVNAFASSNAVTVPDGVYSINNTSEIELSQSNRHVILSPNAILDFTTNGMGIVITGTDVVWEGGHLRGTGAVSSTATSRCPSMLLVDGDGSALHRNVTVRNIKVTEANHSGIGFYRCIGATAESCVVEDDSGDTAVSRFGIWANDCAHISIVNNPRISGFGTCIAGGGNSGAYTFDSLDGETGSGTQRGITVHNNHCHNFADHGVYFSDYQIQTIVTDNHINGGDGEPIKIQGDYITCKNNICRDSAGGFVIRAGRQVEVTGNKIEVSATGSNVFGIFVAPDDPFNYDLADIIIRGNTVKSTNSTGAWHGIYVYGVSNSTDYDLSRLIIESNIVEGYWAKLNTDPAGIYVRVGQLGSTTAEIDLCRIAGNIVDIAQDHTNDNRGISLIFNANHVSVNGNMVRGFVEHGIYADGCDYISIGDNHIIGYSSTATNGIRTETDCTVVRIGSNIFENCTTNVNSPSAVGAWRTPRVIEGASAWNPASIADGAKETVSFTVTGAAAGDPVIAGMSVDIQELSISANVVSADTVEVTLANSTGGAVNVANGNVFVRVFKRDA